MPVRVNVSFLLRKFRRDIRERVVLRVAFLIVVDTGVVSYRAIVVNTLAVIILIRSNFFWFYLLNFLAFLH